MSGSYKLESLQILETGVFIGIQAQPWFPSVAMLLDVEQAHTMLRKGMNGLYDGISYFSPFID